MWLTPYMARSLPVIEFASTTTIFLQTGVEFREHNDSTYCRFFELASCLAQDKVRKAQRNAKQNLNASSSLISIDTITANYSYNFRSTVSQRRVLVVTAPLLEHFPSTSGLKRCAVPNDDKSIPEMQPQTKKYLLRSPCVAACGL